MTTNKLWSMQEVFYDSVLKDKYCKADEATVDDVFRRVAHGLAAAERADARADWEARFLQAMQDGFCPAGRVMSACGTDIQATLINCFVQPVGDAVSEDASGRPGIYAALMQAAETLRRGGGVGYDFSHIRPKGARVRGTRSRASGPVSYMRVFDRSCETVESAGARRGAQMGILRCDHPDIEEFVAAKDIRAEAQKLRSGGVAGADLDGLQQRLRTLSNFNLSVACTDAFMQAVIDDGEHALVHDAEPDPTVHPQAYRRDSDGRWVYRVLPARELFRRIMETTYHTADPGVVFIDRMNADNNLHYCETIEATNPCGEEPLPDYGCCCLGSVNLSRYVQDAFSAGAQLDWEKLEATVAVAVRMLDNVLDITYWPLPQQAREAADKRRVGLGFTALGTAMAMLRLRYGSDEAVAFAERVAQTMRDAAYRASIALAQERGRFPRLDAEAYLQSGFARRLPDDIRDGIHTHGIRNSHLLAIAPTGTISLAFGRNVTGGIEPAFAWYYTRTARSGSGEKISWPVEDYAYRLYRELGGDVEHLPDYFVSAQTLGVADHLRIQAAVQPYIDTSISKTIGVPVDYPFADFENVYIEAWTLGCKGCTTYRPNDVTGAVLTVAPEPAAKPAQLAADDPDRRVRLDQVPAPALASLRWPGRPQLLTGNPSWTYMIEDGGVRFAVFVGHTENGTAWPFEAWVNGAEQPRGLGATAKLLSMDMRSNDRAWLRRKLDSLECTGGQLIRVALPPDGREVVLGSPTAAFAKLVRLRCEQLGAFAHDGPTPVLNALMSEHEPKTSTDGTMSWTVDVCNPGTGDDFVLTLKELLLPDGSRRPYSVWLAGDYPRDFDGLARLLTLDMRIIDVAWIGAKLRKLLSYAEPLGDFFAPTPGSAKSQTWPSTIAYLARLILHRYQMLGLLDAEGRPTRPMGVLEAPACAMRREGAATAIAGRRCPDCGAYAVIKRDGCDACTACGHVGNCG
ncbi:adenosylcobalamin-dependent ribonucleoside-diphosphate reductase [Sinimarinibacterium sp. CAU 1509]|uniref:adenosylcobalamin-dependent ribonucleoside-diphosphate reductase n=1 Tax=Sinimarinibacterium sp. CAU 1509 TaxID=2562283 RepID=UPI0010AD2A2B|nr:adenosylcobalamin-dependent ribonucleoside-diphosphate reductase [Sinimarinibacterium sp. CAU 1509]TJY56233.1 adenosylcobalamin-dependent ribonucleoside-diphosphate reductase [Sinimarinibacterium sp. CAU 1509]